MKIHIVWDPLYEKVISAHKTEIGADNKCELLNGNEDRRSDNAYYLYTNDEFELED